MEKPGMGYNGDPNYVRTKVRPTTDKSRRLMPAELAKAAAGMGLPVSATRYQAESEGARNRRAAAYQEAIAEEGKARPRAAKAAAALAATLAREPR